MFDVSSPMFPDSLLLQLQLAMTTMMAMALMMVIMRVKLMTAGSRKP